MNLSILAKQAATSTPLQLHYLKGPVQSDLFDIAGKIFEVDNLPKELREWLLMKGFIKMDSAKHFESDRCLMFDQIAGVDSKGMHLGVEDTEDLLR